jgi:prepilin-type N-terminal cleavage/methylation domain-containing protein
MKLTKNDAGGFTLIELIITMTIAGILAASAVPAMMKTSNRRLYRASHELAMHVKYARSLAVATGRLTWIRFDTGTETYEAFIEHPTSPGRANRIAITHPVTGAASFVTYLDQDDFEGVAIDSANFGGTVELSFDRLGQPYTGWAALLASDGTVTISANGATRTVRVVAETGMVREE